MTLQRDVTKDKTYLKQGWGPLLNVDRTPEEQLTLDTGEEDKAQTEEMYSSDVGELWGDEGLDNLGIKKPGRKSGNSK